MVTYTKQSHTKKPEKQKKVLRKNQKPFEVSDLGLSAPTETIYSLKNQTWALLKITQPKIQLKKSDQNQKSHVKKVKALDQKFESPTAQTFFQFSKKKRLDLGNYDNGYI